MIRRLSPATARAAAWLDQRSARERVLLQIMAVVGLIAALWYGVLLPLATARQTALNRIALYERLQTRLRTAPTGANAASPAPTMDGPLVDAARSAAAAQAVAAQIEGDGDQITLAARNVRYEAATSLLMALEAGGAVLGEVRMTATDQPGLIDLTASAARP